MEELQDNLQGDRQQHNKCFKQQVCLLSLAAGPIASPPGPVPAAPANANNGVPMMATSAQISMGQMAPAGGAPTVINNYYTQAGGGGTQVGFPNSAFAASGMESTGTALFQQLRLATS